MNPIQALMVNRFLCMQFEIVKVLWLYDKKNCFTNIVLIWVLIEGVRKEGIFDNRDSVDRFESLRRQVEYLLLIPLYPGINLNCYFNFAWLIKASISMILTLPLY